MNPPTPAPSARKEFIPRVHPHSFTSMASGRKFWPLEPRTEDVYLEDIAHGLSMQCRWGGHVREFYSVAQHCVLVSQHCTFFPDAGLLHDAAEAYLVDVPSPIKKHLKVYDVIERRLLECIGRRFDIPFIQGALPSEVVIADAEALATEQRDLRAPVPGWNAPELPWKEKIVPMSPKEAKAAFLARAFELGIR